MTVAHDASTVDTAPSSYARRLRTPRHGQDTVRAASGGPHALTVASGRVDHSFQTVQDRCPRKMLGDGAALMWSVFG